MTQADRVHSTPPTTTSAIGVGFRRLLSHPIGPVPLVAVLIIGARTVLLHLLIAVMP